MDREMDEDSAGRLIDVAGPDVVVHATREEARRVLFAPQQVRSSPLAPLSLSLSPCGTVYWLHGMHLHWVSFRHGM